MSLTIRMHQLSFSSVKKDNLNKLLNLMDESDANLDIFPEYAMGVPSTGLNKEYVHENAESLEGEFVNNILKKTYKKNSVVVFTTYLKEEEKIFNAAILAGRGEVKVVYKKIHLFDAFGYKESDLFTAGSELAMTEFKGFNIGLAVCFDLRFPELFRIMAYKGVNLFILPSAWYAGKYKLEQWKSLLMARAHENTSYFIGVNQVKPTFVGHSIITSPLCYVIKEMGEEEKSTTVTLDYKEIEEARNIVPTIELSKPELYEKFKKII